MKRERKNKGRFLLQQLHLKFEDGAHNKYSLNYRKRSGVQRGHCWNTAFRAIKDIAAAAFLFQEIYLKIFLLHLLKPLADHRLRQCCAYNF